MPGFFESIKRLVEGKPVFDVNDQHAGWANKDGQIASGLPPTDTPQPAAQQPQQRAQEAGIIKGNPATFPVVYVKHTRAHLNGANMDVYCHVLNSSRGHVELEEISLAGRSRRLGQTLRGGEEREVLAYSGSRLRSEGPHEAHLNYKTENGDYFQSVHDVEYQLESDRTYSVEELRLRRPIRDIYG